MMQESHSHSTGSLKDTLFKLLHRVLAIALIAGLQVNTSLAQQVDTSTHVTDAQTSSAPQGNLPVNNGNFTLPAGTRLPLGLVRPLSIKKTKAGDTVYLQITFPISVGTQMLIPPGTYLQGTIGKVVRRDRTRAQLEFELNSASIIYSTGYTVNVTGAYEVVPTIADLTLPDTGSPQSGGPQTYPPGVMAATGTTTPPTLPAPSLGNGPRNAIIGLAALGAVGTALLVIFARKQDVEMEAGTTMQMVLPAPVALDRDSVLAAAQRYGTQVANSAPQIVQPPKPRICYDPGTPGTPDTVIPGTPGTPPTVIPGAPGSPDIVIPGSAETPPTVIPGSPGTPSSTYPCR